MLVCTFSLGELYLGIDIVLVREINQSLGYTSVPGAPDHIRGMLNIRGSVITMFNLKQRLNMVKYDKIEEQENIESNNDPQDSDIKTPKKQQQFNIILRTKSEVNRINRSIAEEDCSWGDPVGLVVDRLGDVQKIEDHTIQVAPANLQGISTAFVRGVVEMDNKLLLILNVGSIFNENEDSENS
ncbi:MAG: chemotaxis protein CheW [Magnetococcales bacterium]|nr:chemotaxis protein CheW [Magnetococcales bacterium]